MMKFSFLRVLAATFMVLSSIVSAAPQAEFRDWKSTAGTAMNGRAIAFDGDEVTLEKSAGGELKVAASKLSAEDQAYLAKQFPNTGGDGNSTQPAVLGQPLGEAIGPIAAPGGSYVLYLPKSLKAGRKAPLLFYTDAGGGAKGKLGRLKEGAEICGWIVAMSVESRNGDVNYFPQIKSCVEHILATLPVDPKRVYFSGSSGGSREAFINSTKLKSAGVLAFIAGAQPGEINHTKHYFFVNGATDYNRAGSAESFSEAKSNAAMRFHPGSHNNGPDWLATEGIVWLECQWQLKTKSDPAAKLDFERAALDWVEKTKATDSNRAAWWAVHLSQMELSSSLRARGDALKKELASTPEAIAYAKAIADIEKFAIDVLRKTPQFSPACFGFTSPEIEKKVNKLLATYGSIPEIKEVLEAFKNKTGHG